MCPARPLVHWFSLTMASDLRLQSHLYTQTLLLRQGTSRPILACSYQSLGWLQVMPRNLYVSYANFHPWDTETSKEAPPLTPVRQALHRALPKTPCGVQTPSPIYALCLLLPWGPHSPMECSYTGLCFSSGDLGLEDSSHCSSPVPFQHPEHAHVDGSEV